MQVKNTFIINDNDQTGFHVLYECFNGAYFLLLNGTLNEVDKTVATDLITTTQQAQ